MRRTDSGRWTSVATSPRGASPSCSEPRSSPTDRFLRTLGWREIAEQEVEALDPEVLAHYEAYADGVNAYLADHDGADASFEYAVLGLQNADYEIEPWTPADSVAWLKAMAWDLRSNIETETERAVAAPDFSPTQLAALYPTYPFDRNPVIVPSITSVPAVGTVGYAGEPLRSRRSPRRRSSGPRSTVSSRP